MTIDQAVVNYPVVIVDFGAEWCPPCKLLAGVLAKAVSTTPVVPVDIDAERELTKKYNVQSVPTLVFLKNGVEKQRTVGLVTEKRIREILESL